MPEKPQSPTPKDESFVKDLACLINRYSLENGSDTPDFVIAEHLAGCLVEFNATCRRREKWYGREPIPVPPELCPQEIPKVNQNHSNILEALGSIVETRCYLRKMQHLSEEGPIADHTAIAENLQFALRESENVLVAVQRLFNSNKP